MGLSVSLKSQSNLAKPLFLYSGTNKPFTIDQPAFLLSSVKEKNDIQMMSLDEIFIFHFQFSFFNNSNKIVYFVIYKFFKV